MAEVVLDASALLALLNDEPGAAEVEKVLPDSVMSTVNASEVIAELYLKLGIPPEEGQSMVSTAINKIIPFGFTQAMMAAQLRAETKLLGLSLGDRACLVLAKSMQLPVYTADKIWQKLEFSEKIVLIR